MSLEVNLQSIKTRIAQGRDAWAAYQLEIEYENLDLVTLSDQVNPYLAVDVQYFDGTQLDLGSTPLIGDYGSIILAAGVKEGSGTAGLLKLLDHFRPYLQLRDDIGNVRTEAAKVQKGLARMGFWFIPMVIPFWVVEPASGPLGTPISVADTQLILDGGTS